MPGQKAPEEARREQILHAAYQVALRAGVDGVTVRAVAAEAGLSHGLVLFHFGRKDQLVAALLDRVLATTALLELSDDVAAMPGSPDRLRAFLRREMQQWHERPDDLRLFFEYWAVGTRDPAIRMKIGAALDRYRAAFRALAEEALRSAPRKDGVTPEGLAAVAVGLITGGAAQAMVDPDAFDLAAYLSTGERIFEPLLPSTELSLTPSARPVAVSHRS